MIRCLFENGDSLQVDFKDAVPHHENVKGCTSCPYLVELARHKMRIGSAVLEPQQEENLESKIYKQTENRLKHLQIMVTVLHLGSENPRNVTSERTRGS